MDWQDSHKAVQEQFGKTEGVVAMHAYQSFKPGEVTPEQCHAIGVELARRVWGGRLCLRGAGREHFARGMVGDYTREAGLR